jgi:hypothetical protein
MSLPLTRPGALLIAARRPDPGNGRLIAAVPAGDPAAAQRAGERLERCDGLIFVITVPSPFRAMLRGSHERRAWLDSLPERVDQQCRAWNLSLDGDPWHGSNALVLPVRQRARKETPPHTRRTAGALARNRPPAQTVSTVRPAARFMSRSKRYLHVTCARATATWPLTESAG